MEKFLGNLSNHLVTIVQQFKIQIPDISFNTKTEIIKLILISEESQLLPNIKMIAVTQLNFKTR